MVTKEDLQEAVRRSGQFVESVTRGDLYLDMATEILEQNMDRFFDLCKEDNVERIAGQFLDNVPMRVRITTDVVGQLTAHSQLTFVGETVNIPLNVNGSTQIGPRVNEALKHFGLVLASDFSEDIRRFYRHGYFTVPVQFNDGK